MDKYKEFAVVEEKNKVITLYKKKDDSIYFSITEYLEASGPYDTFFTHEYMSEEMCIRKFPKLARHIGLLNLEKVTL